MKCGQVYFLMILSTCMVSCMEGQNGMGHTAGNLEGVEQITAKVMRPAINGIFPFPDICFRKDIYNYDGHGNIVRESHFGRKGLFCRMKHLNSMEFVWDNGKIKKAIYRTGENPTPYSTDEYIYNDFEKVAEIRTLHYMDMTMTAKKNFYDSLGRLSYSCLDTGTGQVRREYAYRSDGTCLVTKDDGEKESEYLICSKTMNMLETYDSTGNIICKCTYDENGNLTRETDADRTIEYSYRTSTDKRGNWIRLTIYVDGKKSETVHRKILYKPSLNVAPRI